MTNWTLVNFIWALALPKLWYEFFILDLPYICIMLLASQVFMMLPPSRRRLCSNFDQEEAARIDDAMLILRFLQRFILAFIARLHSCWCITLSFLPQVPARIEKLINEKQFYAAVQLHVQSALMLEREGLQTVGQLKLHSWFYLHIFLVAARKKRWTKF